MVFLGSGFGFGFERQSDRRERLKTRTTFFFPRGFTPGPGFGEEGAASGRLSVLWRKQGRQPLCYKAGDGGLQPRLILERGRRRQPLGEKTVILFFFTSRAGALEGRLANRPLLRSPAASPESLTRLCPAVRISGQNVPPSGFPDRRPAVQHSVIACNIVRNESCITAHEGRQARDAKVRAGRFQIVAARRNQPTQGGFDP